MLSLQMACASHRGAARERNEDSVLICPEQGLVLLADGMGGHQAGEVASRLAIETVFDSMLRSNSAYDAVIDAHNALLKMGGEVSTCEGMGTTLLVGQYVDQRFEWVYAGDSRVYQFRDGALSQLSHDHTLWQTLQGRGDESDSSADAQDRGYQHILTSAVGIESLCKPEFGSCTAQAGDGYLFCTDGLYRCIGDEGLRSALTVSRTALETIEALVDAVLQAGAPDDCSAVLVSIDAHQ